MYNVQDCSVLYDNWCLLGYMYMRVTILLTCGKHLHDIIILLEGEVWAHEASFTPTFYGSTCTKPVSGHVIVS